MRKEEEEGRRPDWWQCRGVVESMEKSPLSALLLSQQFSHPPLCAPTRLSLLQEEEFSVYYVWNRYIMYDEEICSIGIE